MASLSLGSEHTGLGLGMRLKRSKVHSAFLPDTDLVNQLRRAQLPHPYLLPDLVKKPPNCNSVGEVFTGEGRVLGDALEDTGKSWVYSGHVSAVTQDRAM